ncbi:MAG: phosphatase PAP2 family protein [Oscillospiraceae bacterium]|jgi:undecaprenyl-diphosphatase|nr:phosphatase PAP2 family protein [Oscillospiraceae bacterium]
MNKKCFFTCLTALIIFTVFAVLTVCGLTASINVELASRIQSWESPALTAFFLIVTNMGQWFVYVPLSVLLLVLPKTRSKIGVPLAATLAVSAAANALLKALFAVPRPAAHRLITERGFGFPSGHAMNGVAFVGVLVILLLRYSSAKRVKVWAITGTVVFLALIGLSRVYLGVHTPCDVFAGYAAGLCVCTACIMVIDLAV